MVALGRAHRVHGRREPHVVQPQRRLLQRLPRRALRQALPAGGQGKAREGGAASGHSGAREGQGRREGAGLLPELQMPSGELVGAGAQRAFPLAQQDAAGVRGAGDHHPHADPGPPGLSRLLAHGKPRGLRPAGGRLGRTRQSGFGIPGFGRPLAGGCVRSSRCAG